MSPWQANVFGRSNVLDTWEGPQLNEEQAKSYAIARWWHDTLEKLRAKRVYSGPEYDQTIQHLRDQAATIMAPTGRPTVIATRKEGDFTRQYSVLPTVRSEQHVGYTVMYKSATGQWEQDRYGGYDNDGNTYDDAIDKWLEHEKGDVSKYEFADPVAQATAADHGEDQSALDRNAQAHARQGGGGSAAHGRGRSLPQKASLTLPGKTVKAMLPVLKKLVVNKSTIPILQNVAIVTRGGKTRIFATDLETAVTYTLEGVSEGDSAVTLPLTSMEAALKVKAPGDLKIAADGGKATLTVGPAESGTDTQSIADYPELPKLTQKVGTLPAPAFLEAVKNVLHGISSEASRFTLDGALLELAPGKATLVTTDGHRLALKGFAAPGIKGEHKVIIGRRALELAQKVFAKEEGNLVLKTDENHIGIESKDGGVKILARRLTGNFPDYQKVIPARIHLYAQGGGKPDGAAGPDAAGHRAEEPQQCHGALPA